MNELDVVRQDIRDLRAHIDSKFEPFDGRLRELEQHSASSRMLAKVALSGLPFAVVGFSFALVHTFGG